jgi:hypothetical protein
MYVCVALNKYEFHIGSRTFAEVTGAQIDQGRVTVANGGEALEWILKYKEHLPKAIGINAARFVILEVTSEVKMMNEIIPYILNKNDLHNHISIDLEFHT